MYFFFQYAKDDESLSAAKSKNRLVIPDEDGSRTAFVKNVSVNTSPAVLQKMISSCGAVSVSLSQAKEILLVGFIQSWSSKQLMLIRCNAPYQNDLKNILKWPWKSSVV